MYFVQKILQHTIEKNVADSPGTFYNVFRKCKFKTKQNKEKLLLKREMAQSYSYEKISSAKYFNDKSKKYHSISLSLLFIRLKD